MSNRRMEAVHALEVYIGEKGYICIRQEDPLGETGDVVALLPQQVPAVCQWLQECAAEVMARVGSGDSVVARTVLPIPLGRAAHADGPTA